MSLPGHNHVFGRNCSSHEHRYAVNDRAFLEHVGFHDQFKHYSSGQFGIYNEFKHYLSTQYGIYYECHYNGLINNCYWPSPKTV
mmetsp:Transcript_146924/g.269865  ORF Transcript_146924/g.269865 Transcript_146924/m.269865 type:complete len:84 (+) Transcript_146924:165-416(+)